MVMVEPRNGFGIDLEVADARPVAIRELDRDEFELAYFEGWVLMLPFVSILWGEIYTI